MGHRNVLYYIQHVAYSNEINYTPIVYNIQNEA